MFESAELIKYLLRQNSFLLPNLGSDWSPDWSPAPKGFSPECVQPPPCGDMGVSTYAAAPKGFSPEWVQPGMGSATTVWRHGCYAAMPPLCRHYAASAAKCRHNAASNAAMPPSAATMPPLCRQVPPSAASYAA